MGGPGPQKAREARIERIPVFAKNYLGVRLHYRRRRRRRAFIHSYRRRRRRRRCLLPSGNWRGKNNALSGYDGTDQP